VSDEGDSRATSTATDTSALKLPRSLEADPLGDQVRDWLVDRLETIRTDGGCHVLWLAPSEPFYAALFDVRRARRLIRGLEEAERRQTDLANGIAAQEKKKGLPEPDESEFLRMSRLLVCSADGSPRFYRQVERLVDEHRGRVFVIVVDADARELALPVFGGDSEARALLVDHKEAVVTVLLAAMDGDANQAAEDETGAADGDDGPPEESSGATGSRRESDDNTC
jgi:hypothetical protein